MLDRKAGGEEAFNQLCISLMQSLMQPSSLHAMIYPSIPLCPLQSLPASLSMFVSLLGLSSTGVKVD